MDLAKILFYKAIEHSLPLKHLLHYLLLQFENQLQNPLSDSFPRFLQHFLLKLSL